MFPTPRTELPGVGEAALLHAVQDNGLRHATPEEIEIIEGRLKVRVERPARVFVRASHDRLLVAAYRPHRGLVIVAEIDGGETVPYFVAATEADLRRLLGTFQ